MREGRSRVRTVGLAVFCLAALLLSASWVGFRTASAAAAATDGGSAGRPPAESGVAWRLALNAQFNQPSLNQRLWTPGWFGTGITGPVNSSEDACYDSAQVTEPGDGFLHLPLLPHANTCGGSTRPYTGSLVSSNPSDGVAGHVGFQYTYGFLEVRAYVPAASPGVIANWPAIWSDGQSWPTDGENDTMEGPGGQACFHFHSPAGGPGACAAGSYAGWHTFGSDWEPGSVTYYYDGVKVGTITTGITSAPQYLILDYTQGAYGGPTVAPAAALIDYVRVWQRANAA